MARLTKNTEWHNWYAWMPVGVSNITLVWLEVVQRKWSTIRKGYEYRDRPNS